ncbi:MAG: ABC transporter permease [Caenispirillum sp.]|nr:ABC transporter permease [Caenispirillum sp.]
MAGASASLPLSPGRLRAVRLAVVFGLILALEVACRAGAIDRYTLLPPSEMVLGAWEILVRGEAWGDIAFTLRNVAASLVLALVVGFLVGIGLHRLPRLRRAVNPLIASYYAVPVFIFYPLFIVVLGMNALPLIAIGFLFAVVAVVVNTLNAFDRVPRVFFKTARVMGLNRAEEVRRVVLPAALPHLFTGLKLAVAYSFIGVIAGEFILAGAGLGYRIAFAYNNFQSARMYGLMVLLLVFVTAVNLTLHAWEHRIHERRGGR